MNGKAIRAIYKFRLRENAFGGASFLAVMALVMGFFVGATYLVEGEHSMNLTTFGAASIMFFVLGIVSILEDLRFGIQGGVSRVTVLVGNLAAAAVLSLGIAVAEITMNVIAQAVVNPSAEVFVGGVYQMLFLRDGQAGLSLGQYGEYFLFNFTGQMMLYGFGMALALMFYRLSKFWRVVGGIALGGLCLVGVPYVGWKLAPYLADLAQWAFSGIWNWMLLALLGMVLLLGVDYLLLRRTPIRGRK